VFAVGGERGVVDRASRADTGRLYSYDQLPSDGQTSTRHRAIGAPRRRRRSRTDDQRAAEFDVQRDRQIQYHRVRL